MRAAVQRHFLPLALALAAVLSACSDSGKAGSSGTGGQSSVGGGPDDGGDGQGGGAGSPSGGSSSGGMATFNGGTGGGGAGAGTAAGSAGMIATGGGAPGMGGTGEGAGTGGTSTGGSTATGGTSGGSTATDGTSGGSSGGSVTTTCTDPGAGTDLEAFVHPGGLYKQSDLDRMRLMVRAGVEPYAAAFQALSNHSRATFNYAVQGNASQTVVNRDGTNGPQFEADATAAYLNALMWAVTGDERHAQKSVEIFNAWQNVTEVTGGGTEALNAGLFAYKMVEAAEIIKSTYDGWSAADIDAFSRMLVYPGYSSTQVPPSLSQNSGSFYWRIYRGDPGRHGNQDLIAWRAMIVMGVFLDNRIMFDRALNYFKGMPHRSDDLPYPSGPPSAGSQTEDNAYFTTYQVGAAGSAQADYGYNGVLANYVWESGQNQESSRDQQHAFFGLGICAGISEVAWNQGDDVYNSLDYRLLKGFEHMARYNVSQVQSFPDQPGPWEPSGADFLQRLDRTGRWFSKQINPYFDSDFSRLSRGDFPGKRPVFEEPLAHYQVRMGLPESETLWIERGRDVSIDQGGYEGVGWSLDHPGWGALTFRRPTWAAGDPIRGFFDGLPLYGVPELPGALQAVHYDHFPVSGEGHTYHDTSPGNSGTQYRDDDVDIDCGAGDRHVVIDLADGEWLSYTVFAPDAGDYPVTIGYSATADGGGIHLGSGGADVTSEVALPGTNGDVAMLPIGTATLAAGVQTLRVYFSGTLGGVELDQITIGPP